MIMNPATESLIGEFFQYNAWANQQILDACAKLSSDQLGSQAEGTYGTLYDTLVHIIRSEASYLHRLTGEREPPPFNWDDRPGLADIRAYASHVDDKLIQAAEKLLATDVIRQEWQGTTVGYKAVVLLIQAVNHGVEHRTNITTILSQLGLEVPEVDGWGYLSAHSDRLEIA